MNAAYVRMTVSSDMQAVPMSVATADGTASPGVGAAFSVQTTPYYADTYAVTPTQYTQILPTAGLRMRGNVTVNPIPSNYGLITWDGSVLTVS